MLRRTSWLGLAIVAVTSGCTHNYYYGATPGCPPIGQPVATQVGQICEMPGATVISSNAAPSDATGAQVVSTPQPQRVVISQPAYGPSFISRHPWRRADPEGVTAVTRSSGALQETSNK